MTKYALIEAILMQVAIISNIVVFYKHSHNAAYLLVPYALWVCVAIYLNYHVVVYNVDPSE
jgi:tryptophan-rich sensory protein